MRRLVSFWPAALSAFLTLAAFPPFNVRFLVFIALVPFLLGLPRFIARGSFKYGYVYGFIFMLGQMHWLEVLVQRWTSSLVLATTVWILCGVLGAVYFGVIGFLFARCMARGLWWMLPLVWAGIEVLRAYIPGLAFPWGLLANPLWVYPGMVQSAYYGSIFLVSGWVALVNVAIFVRALGSKRQWVPLLTASLAILMISWARYTTPIVGAPVNVTVGQPGADMAFASQQDVDTTLRLVVPQFYGQARRDKSGLLVLPEGVAGETGSFPPDAPFEIQEGVPILFGGKRGLNPSYQSAFLYEDGLWSYADKTRLVIFGEYVPGRDWIPFLSAFHLPGGDLQAGRDVTALHTRYFMFGPLLCFEGLFPDLAFRQARNGAQMLTVMSIDDWYMQTSAPEQLRSASAWRAMETGLPLVRSASLGYSLAVDSRGRLLQEAPLGKTECFTANFLLPEPHPEFAALPLFPAFFLLTTLVPWFLPLRRRAKEKD